MELGLNRGSERVAPLARWGDYREMPGADVDRVPWRVLGRGGSQSRGGAVGGRRSDGRSQAWAG